MQTQIIEIAIIVALVLILAALFLAVRCNIHYRITAAFLEIRLFGITLRRIRLDDIKAITTKQIFWAESWCNTFFAQNRRLVIQRYSGLFKHIVISPAYRFVFRTELAEAKRDYAASLADRPVFTLPRPSIVQQIYRLDWAALARKTGQTLRKASKACQALGSIFG